MTKVCTCSYLVRINTIVARYLKAQAGRCPAMEPISEVAEQYTSAQSGNFLPRVSKIQ